MKRIAAASAHAASWLALGPSLVPRTWWMTAISVAINAYGGQKAAEAFTALRRPAGRRSGSAAAAPPPAHPVRPDRSAHLTGIKSLLPATFRTAKSAAFQPDSPHVTLAEWRRSSALLALAVTGTGIALSRSVREQADISKRTGLHAESPYQQLIGYCVGGIGWLGLDLLSYGSNQLRRLLQTRLHRAAPFVPDLLVGAAATAAVAYSWRQVITTAFAHVARQAVLSDFARPSLARRPREPERTGSRYSLEPFGTLGNHGRAFVWEGPRNERIAEVAAKLSGQDRSSRAGAYPRTPVRVFIGKIAHPDLADAAAAAVAELERTGAFDRPHLLLASNTGSGWLPKWSVSAFEYLTHGNCASVAIQYSFAGSWLAFLIFRDQAELSSKYLLEAIEAHLRDRPAEARPKLYMTGESLGALGGHGAFVSLEDMRDRLAGALWTGTPRTTAIPKQLYRSRHYLSTELRPLIGRGAGVRFVQKPKHVTDSPLGGKYAPWDGARIIYAQHSSDPVVWWEPALLWRRPDWLREPRGKDVSPHLGWLPWVTFWQLLADMPRSVKLPGGHGHNYHREVVHYWNEILGLGHTKKDCSRIGDAIAEDLAGESGSLNLTNPAPWKDLAEPSFLRRSLRSLRTVFLNGPAQ